MNDFVSYNPSDVQLLMNMYRKEKEMIDNQIVQTIKNSISRYLYDINRKEIIRTEYFFSPLNKWATVEEIATYYSNIFSGQVRKE